MAILVSEGSGSAAELFAAGLQEAGRARIVGAQTCGCVLGITKHRVMTGGGALEISEVLWFSPKGRKLEGEGVIPDRVAAPTVASLWEKRDVVLDEAVKMLREATAKTAPTAAWAPYRQDESFFTARVRRAHRNSRPAFSSSD